MTCEAESPNDPPRIAGIGLVAKVERARVTLQPLVQRVPAKLPPLLAALRELVQVLDHVPNSDRVLQDLCRELAPAHSR